MMNAKATKNEATFEAINTAEGILYTVSNGNYLIVLTPCDGFYLATLYAFSRPVLNAEGDSAKWALHRLTVNAKETAWTEENFFAKTFFPMAKDLNEWVKRPMRETYNAR